MRPSVLRSTTFITLFIGLAAAACVGCAGSGRIETDSSVLPSGEDLRYSDADWAEVLRTHVKDGLVDYDALKKNAKALQRYTAILSATGPSSTPQAFDSLAKVMAYWINAYNACVLRAVLDRYPLTTMYDLNLPRLETDYRFQVDGQWRTLMEMETAALEASQRDARVFLALSRAAIGTPRLDVKPMRPETLQQQLTETASRALANPYILRIESETQTIFVWQVILRRRVDFMEYWRTHRRVREPSLLDVLVGLASASVRAQLGAAAGYRIREMPFNRALNRWSPRHRWPVIR